MRAMVMLSIAAIALSLSGCSIMNALLPQPDVFYINRWNFSGRFAVAHNMSALDSVQQIADNSLLLHSGATVAIASEKLTDFEGDFSITLSRGSGLRLATRTVEHFYATEKGIAFVYAANGSYIEENGKEIARIDSVRAVLGQQARILILNEGKKYSVQVGCDIIYRGETSLPSTEYVIAEPLPGTKAEIAAIDFYPIRMGRPYDINREKPWGSENGMEKIKNEYAKRRR